MASWPRWRPHGGRAAGGDDAEAGSGERVGIRQNDHQASTPPLPVHADMISDMSRLSSSIIVFPVNVVMLSVGTNPSQLLPNVQQAFHWTST